MSILSRITGRTEKVETKDIGLADPALLSLFGGLTTAAGVTVGEATAMRQPTSGAAIRLLAGVLATTKVYLLPLR